MSTCSQKITEAESSRKNTASGKSHSSRNAMVTGLTGRTVLLATDDVDQYALHLSGHHAEYLPITEAESELVQSIADCEWRLRRIISLEAGIYAMGEREFADYFPEDGNDVRTAFIKVHTHLTYQRELSSLALQETRLLRQKEKFIAALEALKKNRPQTPAGVSHQIPAAAAAGASCSAVGFEFTNAYGSFELTPLVYQNARNRSV